jgi:hypothetical protein
LHKFHYSLVRCRWFHRWSCKLLVDDVHFINSRSSVVRNCGTNPFNVLLSSGCWMSQWSFCISYTYATILESVNPFIYTLLK